MNIFVAIGKDIKLVKENKGYIEEIKNLFILFLENVSYLKEDLMMVSNYGISKK